MHQLPTSAFQHEDKDTQRVPELQGKKARSELSSALRNEFGQQSADNDWKCDGVRPRCSQCDLRRLRCSGYKQEFVFVPVSVRNTISQRNSARRKVFTSTRAAPPLDASERNAKVSCQSVVPLPAIQSIGFGGMGICGIEASSRDLEQDIRFIVKQYASADTEPSAKAPLSQNQVCGAWIDILPVVTRSKRSNKALISAIGTLATVLRYYAVEGHVCHPSILGMYCRTLESLGNALAKAQNTFHIENCVAVMCLADADVRPSSLPTKGRPGS